MLEQVGAEAIAVKQREQLRSLDALVIPGGESTTISKLMHEYGFMEDVRRFPAEQKPLFGTCAGAILLANRIHGQREAYLGVMDMKVERNGFGRQKDSFEAILPVAEVAADFPAVFIRAPYMMEVGPSVQVLAKYDGKIVAARQGLCLACSFHPELTDDYRLHKYFLNMVQASRAEKG